MPSFSIYMENPRSFLEFASLSSFFNRYCNSNSSANHRVVAHADQTHHLNVCRYGGRTSELRVRVHTAQSIGETVRSGTCSHVIGMQSTSGTTTEATEKYFFPASSLSFL